jgi:hypothetical protein
VRSTPAGASGEFGGQAEAGKELLAGYAARAVAGGAALAADGPIKPGIAPLSCTPAGCRGCSAIPGSRT